MGHDSYLPRDRAWQPPAYYPDYRSTHYRSPQKALLSFPTSMSEEAGPVFGHAMLGPKDADMVHNFAAEGHSAIGPRIVVHGKVMDQMGRPVPNTLVEVWQANAGGRYRHVKDGYFAPLDDNFGGYGRVVTDEDGYYRFFTIQPGPYPWPNGGNDWRPAHIHFSLFGRSFAQRLITQLYFEGDPLIPLCPIAQAIPDKAGVDRLVARLDMENATPMDHLTYRFDIVLRGRNQTLFENKPEGM